MSKIFSYYRSFPDSFEATEYSKRMSFMTTGLRMLGGLLTFACFSASREVFYSYRTEDNDVERWIFIVAVYCVLAFDYYAFLYRKYQTNYGLNVIFLNEAYRRAAVYGEEKHSDTFIEACKKERDEEETALKKKHKKRIMKSAAIYVFCVLIATIVIII